MRDIQHNIDLVISFTTSTNQEEFLKDEMRSMATAKAIENIGEAVKQISPQLKDRYPDVDWVGPARMRDRTAHGYWSINYKIVWYTATEEIPVLQGQIIQILTQEFSS
ncbi:MAG: DUF86 domain-containing protein [Anaerolineaceae bacterium]|nr:DUF86 domain-containing protein [Anaerolineaceae bacterium]MCB9102060.1 DUF86 domain-containing protein [Anaerolineales bacterium]